MMLSNSITAWLPRTKLQELVSARTWRFNSSPPHQRDIRRPGLTIGSVGALFWQQSSPDGRWTVVVEEDKRVCYAYLYDRHTVDGANPISGEVWLYNLRPAPSVAEWTLTDAQDRMPFLNAAEFVAEQEASSSVRPEQLDVKWSSDGPGLITADIYVEGALYGRLKPGSKPGWSTMALRRSPIAMPLTGVPTDGDRPDG